MELLKNKNKIRKRWLFSFKITIAFIAVDFAILLLCSALLNPSGFPVLALILSVLSAIIGLELWAEYRCGYQKPGTKYLAFTLIAFINGIVTQMFNLINGKNALVPLLLIALFIWRFVTAYNLRELNKAIKKEDAKKSESVQSLAKG